MVSFGRAVGTVALQLHKFAGPLVVLVYPLYASVAAIESPFKEDDTQWLTYWVLYSFFQLVELGFEHILYWVPFWGSIKLLGFGWLVLPQFHGAAFIYETCVKHYVKQYIGGVIASRNEKMSPQQRQLIQQMSPQARASVSAFISEHGSSAFDSVVATINVGTNQNVRYSTFADRHTVSPIIPAQPCRYPISPRGVLPTSRRGFPGAAEPYEYTGSPPSAEPTRYTGSPGFRERGGFSRSDSFREYCRQPVRLLKTSLHSLGNRRDEMRAKMRTNFVT